MIKDFSNVFTPGTPFKNSNRFFNEALKTLKDIKRPGIFLSKGIKSIPENLPDYVFAAEFLPLEKLLDKCSLIVHHGGIGTTCQGIRSTVPQIILFHQGLDQKNNAEIIEKTGICRKIQYEKMSSEKITGYIKEFLTDEVKKKCLEVRTKTDIKSSKRKLLEYILQLQPIIAGIKTADRKMNELPELSS